MKNFINLNATEEEQAEKIKHWLKDNLLFIIGLLIIGFGGFYGWDYYKEYQYKKNVDARIAYLKLVNNKNEEQIDLSSHNEYNNQALMLKAKNNLDDIDYAIEKLNNIQSETLINDVKNIKLAQLYLAQKDYTKAEDLLENNSLESTKFHLLGDIYQAQNKLSLAKEIYQKALEVTNNQRLKLILSIKIASIE